MFSAGTPVVICVESREEELRGLWVSVSDNCFVVDLDAFGVTTTTTFLRSECHPFLDLERIRGR